MPHRRLVSIPLVVGLLALAWLTLAPHARSAPLAQIAFVSDSAGNDDIFVMNGDGTGVHQVTNDPAAHEDPVWSPDGTRLAFLRIGANVTDIYVVRAGGGGEHLLAEGSCPVWSPTGNRLAFTRFDQRTETNKIFTIRANGTNEQLVTNGGCPAWSPDGSLLAFPGNTGGLFTVDPAGGTITDITPGDVQFVGVPSWSPDGQGLAFPYSFSPQSFPASLGAEDRDGGNFRTAVFHGESTGVGHVIWSPDGQSLAFDTLDSFGGSSTAIYVVPADSQGLLLDDLTPLADTASRGDALGNWSPDSAQLTFESYPGTRLLAASDSFVEVVGSDGNGLDELATGASPVFSPVFPPPSPSPSPSVSPSPSPSPSGSPSPTTSPGPSVVPSPTVSPSATSPGPTQAGGLGLPTGSPGPSAAPSTSPSASPSEPVSPQPSVGPSPSSGPGAIGAPGGKGHGGGGAGRRRSVVASSVHLPGQVPTSFRDVGTSLLAALALMLILLFPSYLFNSTLEEHYDEVRRWFAFIPALPAWTHRRAVFSRRWFALGFFGALGAGIYMFLNPGFGWNIGSLSLFLGLLAGILVVTLLSDLPQVWYVRHRYGERGTMRVLHGTVLVSILCVAVSRLVHFLPGYIYGLIAAYAWEETDLNEQEEGRAIGWSTLWLMAVAVMAWIAWIPASHGAARPNAGLGVLVLDAVLVAVFVTGLEGAVLGMVPLRFMDGHKVMRWSRAGWAIIFTLGMFGFIHILLNPKSGYLSHGNVPFLVVAALFVGFGLFSSAFWGYFRFRAPRELEGGMEAGVEFEPHADDRPGPLV